MNNKPVAWIGETLMGRQYINGQKGELPVGTPLYTHLVNPAICVGHWDNKTGAFHKHLTETQQKRVDEGFLQPVYTAGMLPIRELTDEEILKVAANKFFTSEHRLVLLFARDLLRKAQEK